MLGKLNSIVVYYWLSVFCFIGYQFIMEKPEKSLIILGFAFIIIVWYKLTINNKSGQK